jgi:HMG (high mobility group) box
MCFKDAKMKEILTGQKIGNAENVLKNVAGAWNQLDERERAYWDEEARNDKVRYAIPTSKQFLLYVAFSLISNSLLSVTGNIYRYVREKNDYKGEWNLPKRRAKKHPMAPKRPMSAFLKYSQNKRSDVKEQNPSMSNTDVSRLLGEMWRNASDEERRPYVQEEQIERANYNERIKEWREEQAKIDASSRKSHHTVPKTHRNELQEPKQVNEKRGRYDSGYTSSSRAVACDIRPPRSHTNQHDRNVFRAYTDSTFDNRTGSMSTSDATRHSHYRHQPYYHYSYAKPGGMTTSLAMSNPEEPPVLFQSSSLSSDSGSRVSTGYGEGASRTYSTRSPMYPHQHATTLAQYAPTRKTRESQQYENPHLRGPSPPPPPQPPHDRGEYQEFDQYRTNNGGMTYGHAKSPGQSSRSSSHYNESFYNLP